MRCSASPALLASTALLAGTASGQITFTLTDISTEGDSVAGVGALTRLDNLETNDAGVRWSEWDTDQADTDTDQVVLVDGSLLLREGDPVPAPLGATIDSFDSIQANDGGDLSLNVFLDGAGIDSNNNSAVYVDFGAGLVLIAQEGDLVPNFAGGATWQGFFETRINDARQVLVLGTVDDPTIGTGSIDDVIVLFNLDASGAVLSTATVASEGLPIVGGLDPIETLESSAHELAFNDSGQVLFAGHTTGDPASDDFIALDGVPLALEGAASPVDGRIWASLASPELDLNNSGQVVYSGTLEGNPDTATVIILDGATFRQEGDAVPAPGLGGFKLEGFGSGPLLVNDAGEVLWYGTWDNPDTDRDSGLFLDDSPIVLEGVTTVAGLVVDTIRGVQDGYAMSDSGNSIVAELVLTGNIDVLVDIARSGSVEILTACVANDAALSVISGAPTIGQSIDLQVSQSPYTLALVDLFFAPSLWLGGVECGLTLPDVGEATIDVASPLLNSLALPSISGPPSVGSFPISDDPALVGISIYFQALLVDATLQDEKPFRLSNALGVTFGS